MGPHKVGEGLGEKEGTQFIFSENFNVKKLGNKGVDFPQFLFLIFQTRNKGGRPKEKRGRRQERIWEVSKINLNFWLFHKGGEVLERNWGIFNEGAVELFLLRRLLGLIRFPHGKTLFIWGTISNLGSLVKGKNWA